MYHVFNMGIGMAFVVSADEASLAMKQIAKLGEKSSIIGTVINQEGVHFQ